MLRSAHAAKSAAELVDSALAARMFARDLDGALAEMTHLFQVATLWFAPRLIAPLSSIFTAVRAGRCVFAQRPAGREYHGHARRRPAVYRL
jgi:hypothetical protein